jgi:hypothetical protein
VRFISAILASTSDNNFGNTIELIENPFSRSREAAKGYSPFVAPCQPPKSRRHLATLIYLRLLRREIWGLECRLTAWVGFHYLPA